MSVLGQRRLWWACLLGCVGTSVSELAGVQDVAPAERISVADVGKRASLTTEAEVDAASLLENGRDGRTPHFKVPEVPKIPKVPEVFKSPEMYIKKFETCPEFHKHAVAVLGLGLITMILGMLNFAKIGCSMQTGIQCMVVSDRKVAVLEQPNIASEPVEYIESGTSFDAVGRVVVGDGRVFYRLANKRGWVPRCSRKDEGKTIVEQLIGGRLAGDKMPAEPSLARRALGVALLIVTLPLYIALVILSFVVRLFQCALSPLAWLCPCGCVTEIMDRTVGLPDRFIDRLFGWST